jgi:tRNA(His) 5'-end guanylyltransferase
LKGQNDFRSFAVLHMNEELLMINPMELKEEARRYEKETSVSLQTKVPVFIRLDGKAFSTLTRNFRKPYDEVFAKSMQQTLHYLCNIPQGCVFGYTASDEITLVLTDYHKLTSCPWFDYRVEKIATIAASKASVVFNRFFYENKEHFYETYNGDDRDCLYEAYNKALESAPVFDGRCFNVPEARVCEMILWRQYDTRRNSIQSLGQAYFSERTMRGKSNEEVLDMLMSEHDVDWNAMPTAYKTGCCCTKGTEPFGRKQKWKMDFELPMLVGDGRRYLQDIMDAVRDPEYYNEE